MPRPAKPLPTIATWTWRVARSGGTVCEGVAVVESRSSVCVAGVRAAAAELREVVEPDPELAPPERLRASLEAYLDYVEHHAAGYVSLMRGGIGSDAEVREIVEESRAVIIDRAIADLPLRTRPTPLLRLAMEGWVGYVEATSLSWLERRRVPRERVRE